MAKKIFYGIVAFIISIIIIITSFFSSITTEGKKLINKAISDQRYDDAVAFYSIAFDSNPVYQYENEETGFLLLVYASLADREEVLEDETQIYIREKSFDFIILNIGKYNYKATTDLISKGALTLTFAGQSEKLTFPYVEYDEDNNILNNNYEYYGVYSYIPLTVKESDLPDEYKDAEITHIRITDSYGGNYVNRNTETPFSFDNPFHNDFDSFLVEYNDLVRVNKGKITADQQAEISEKLDAILANPNYRLAYGVSVIVGLSSFRWKMFGVVAACIVGSILLGVFIFVRKTPSFIPETPAKPTSSIGIETKGDKGSE